MMSADDDSEIEGANDGSPRVGLASSDEDGVGVGVGGIDDDDFADNDDDDDDDDDDDPMSPNPHPADGDPPPPPHLGRCRASSRTSSTRTKPGRCTSRRRASWTRGCCFRMRIEGGDNDDDDDDDVALLAVASATSIRWSSFGISWRATKTTTKTTTKGKRRRRRWRKARWLDSGGTTRMAGR